MINKKAKNIILLICIMCIIIILFILNILYTRAESDCLKLHDGEYCKQAINDLKK